MYVILQDDTRSIQYQTRSIFSWQELIKPNILKVFDQVLFVGF